MSQRLLYLTARIREELVELARIVDRVREGWQRAQQSEDDLYIDSVALNLHGFYGGLERLFELIASTIDKNVPKGANPDISRVRGVHLQGIQGHSRTKLLQALDNTANRRLGLARRVKIIEKLNKKFFGTNWHLTTRNKIVNNKLF